MEPLEAARLIAQGMLVGVAALYEHESHLRDRGPRERDLDGHPRRHHERPDDRGEEAIDGRYVGTAPLSDLSLGAGKHDLQVRDGAKILAEGVLTVPKGASVRVNIRHP